jgi:hypothetical protein
MRRFLFLPLAVIFALLVTALPARAEFLDFTALSLNSSTGVTLGAVTINGAIASNSAGLGVIGVGLDSTIDRILTWEAGADLRNVTQVRDGSLSIVVDGLINAFTIAPFMEIIEGPAPASMPHFDMSYRPGGANVAPVTYYKTVTPFAPTTFQFLPDGRPSTLSNVGLESNFGQYVFFSNYRQTFNNPAAVIRFGYSITSLDYTPNVSTAPGTTVNTPEPSTLLLAGAAAAAGALRRRRKQRPNGVESR